MNIIVIGPDGSGKTTFCKKLCEITDMEYHKCSIVDECKQELVKKLLTTKDNTVFDRFYYPDDIIYSKVLEGIDKHQEMLYLEDYFTGNELVIYMYESIDVLKERISIRGDEYIKEEQLEEIMMEYEKFIANTDIPIMRTKGNGLKWNL